MSRKNIFIILLMLSISLTFIGTASAGWTEINMPLIEQINDHYCGPASLRMVGLSWGYDVSQDSIASWAWTDSSGTGHSGLANAALHFFGASKFEYKWNQVGQSTANNLLSGSRYILHINTAGLHYDAYGNMVWEHDYYHYIAIKGIDVANKLVKVNDPSKSTNVYTFNQMANAVSYVSQNSVLRFDRTSVSNAMSLNIIASNKKLVNLADESSDSNGVFTEGVSREQAKQIASQEIEGKGNIELGNPIWRSTDKVWVVPLFNKDNNNQSYGDVYNYVSNGNIIKVVPYF
ncbi:MAG: C39 family peptidase [Methanobrevibacter sp.]|nr:C39 family peptidase [Methanobrevibacter sp.]